MTSTIILLISIALVIVSVLIPIKKTKKPKVKVYKESEAPVVRKSASPYQLIVTNTSKKKKKVVLFGDNKYLLQPNFGSDKGVVVQPGTTNVDYVQILRQSGSQPFETSLIRIMSQNASQITQNIGLHSYDANGQYCYIPVITSNYFSAMQYQSTIIDIDYNMCIDANTHLDFEILPKTSVVVTIFPASKVNFTRLLNQVSAFIGYEKPNVPYDATPVYSKASFGDSSGMGPKLSRWTRIKLWFKKMGKSCRPSFIAPKPGSAGPAEPVSSSPKFDVAKYVDGATKASTFAEKDFENIP